jgi:glycosyltransferase involved in cell wall biosynthesis
MPETEQDLRPSPSVTVAVPLFNEVDTLDELLKRIGRVLDALPRPEDHEILCVDDGSTDQTLSRLVSLRSEYPRLKVLALSRNFGHQAAVSAAMDHATRETVFVMDGDLQDRPEVLPEFVEAYRRGADVVYARRRNRPNGVLLRSAYSLHYRLLAAISDAPVHTDAGDFALLSRRSVDLIRGMPERQRYVRGLRSWIGLEQVGIDVDRDERFAGDSKYSMRALVSLALDGVFAFSRVPLRVATLLGLGTVIAGFIYGVVVVIDWLGGGPPQGFAALALLQIVFFGVLLLVLGVIGEYVGRIYDEVKRRPVYVVGRVWEVGGGGE